MARGAHRSPSGTTTLRSCSPALPPLPMTAQHPRGCHVQRPSSHLELGEAVKVPRPKGLVLHDQWDDAALELGHEGVFLCGFKGGGGGGVRALPLRHGMQGRCLHEPQRLTLTRSSMSAFLAERSKPCLKRPKSSWSSGSSQ